jgi:hypothetical protein
VVLRPDQVTRASMARAMVQALDPTLAPSRVARLHELVGANGRDQAVETIRRVIAEKVQP